MSTQRRAISNRKKVRGLKKHRRRVDAWIARCSALPLTIVDGGDRAWCKLALDPWFRLVRRDPPAWLQRRMLEGLMRLRAMKPIGGRETWYVEPGRYVWIAEISVPPA